MSKRLVIILWSIVAVLAVITLIVKSQRGGTQESVTALDSGEVILENIPLKDLAKFQIEDAEETTTITKGEEKWLVTERSDYPVDFRRFSDFLRTLTQMTVAQSMQAGPAFNERFGMDTDSEIQENHGFKLTFFNDKNEPIESLLVGKQTDNDSGGFNPGSAASSGRYLRLTSDPNAIYTVNQTLSNLTGDPASWLDSTFIQVGNIQSIAFQPAEETGMTGWTMSREEADGEFTMADLPDGETLDADKARPLRNTLSSPQFEDVLTAEEAADRRDENQARKATVTTFDGLTYTLDYAPAKPEEDKDATAATSQTYIVSVEITGELNETREPAEGETEEEAQAADARFADQLAASKERLANEKTFEGRYFVIPDYVFSQFDKSREEFFQTEETNSATPGGLPGSQERPTLTPQQMQQLQQQMGVGAGRAPSGRREAVTEPIEVPAPESDSETESGEPDSFRELSDEDIERITEEARQAEEQE